LYVLVILILTIYWMLSFFGQSILPGIPHNGSFTDILAVLITLLIMFRFLMWLQ
jgi:hypothetical protein